MRVYSDNQPVTIRSTGKWGRVTGFKHWMGDKNKPIYRVEDPTGIEGWYESYDVRPSTVWEPLNTPYFWTVGALFLLVALCAFGVL